MRPKRQAHRDVVLHDFLPQAHFWQQDLRLHDALTVEIAAEQGQFVTRHQGLRRPKRVAAGQ